MADTWPPPILVCRQQRRRRRGGCEEGDQVQLRACAGGPPCPCAGSGLRRRRPRDDRRDERPVEGLLRVRPLRRPVSQAEGFSREVCRGTVRGLPLPVGTVPGLIRRVPVSSSSPLGFPFACVGV